MKIDKTLLLTFKLVVMVALNYTPDIVYSQTQTKLIITSVLESDRTINKNGILYFDYGVTKNQVVYYINKPSGHFVTKNILIENYKSISNRDSIIETKLIKSAMPFRNKLKRSEFARIQKALNTDIDSIEKGFSLHTSHNYLNIYIEIIENGDTVLYSKTKPFEYNTPWHKKGGGKILNPNIDFHLAMLLPSKFIGREKLIPLRKEKNQAN